MTEEETIIGKSETIQNIADNVEEQLLTDFFKAIIENVNIRDMSIQVAYDALDFFSKKFTKAYSSPLLTYGEVRAAGEDFISARELVNEGVKIMLQD